MRKSVKEKSGLHLDLGCGENKNKGFVGIDKRDLPGVDIVHDMERFPWPVQAESCLIISGSHIIEHIKPWLTIDFMNELWRIMKPGGQLALSHPYGVSPGFVQDPTHCNPCNEGTWQYFDPRYFLYAIYKPKPWFIEKGFPAWQVTGNMEVVFHKISMEEAAELMKKGLVG
jgi:hypothetical protein